MKETTEYFECAYYSPEHTISFSFFDEQDSEIYASVFLNQYRNVFKRIWIAIKYIFGYKCKYGHWDCFILREKDAIRLKKMLNKYMGVIKKRGN